jgi:single-strand DNA-binding protein
MLNQVTICGRLGRDPELRRMNNGNAVCNLNMATSERWKDKASGEMKEKTEWHRVVIFAAQLAEAVERNSKKGDMLLVQGKLQTRKWTDKDGNDKYTTEIVIDFNGTVKFLTPKSESGSGSDGGDAGYDEGRAIEDIDDDVPF